MHGGKSTGGEPEVDVKRGSKTAVGLKKIRVCGNFGKEGWRVVTCSRFGVGRLGASRLWSEPSSE